MSAEFTAATWQIVRLAAGRVIPLEAARTAAEARMLVLRHPGAIVVYRQHRPAPTTYSDPDF
jgi:hypothetical protein